MNRRKTLGKANTCSNVDLKVADISKDFQNLNSDPNKPLQATLHGTDNIFNINYVERELECQICLSPLESPVLLACNSHSLCLSCLKSLYEHQTKQKDGSRAIFCPSCGVLSGIMKIKKLEHIRINRELERVQKAYDKEKILWVEEKLKLETDLHSLKSSKGEKLAEENQKKNSNKKGLTSEEEINLRDMLENFGPEKLHEASQLILDMMEKNTPVVKKRATRKTKENFDDKDEGVTTSSEKESTKKRSSSQKLMWDYTEKIVKKTNSAAKRKNPETVQAMEKREYPLRGLKRTRTLPI